MPAKGKHRRPKSNSLSRGLAAAGAGGAVLAMPVIGATTAAAAPASVHTATVASVSAAAKPATAVKASPLSYDVVSGDSLSKIADAFHVSGGWKQLYQDNQSVIGGKPAMIHPGMRLTLGGKAPAPAATTTARDASLDRADRSARQTSLTTASTTSYANNLDGWIRQSLDIMGQNGIPGTYDGIYRNIMRESSGNPMAINNWDSNAVAGTPSKGLLQVIQPTFTAFHVAGTSTDLYDPVANITAACNYAAKTYGSIDNVFGAY
ncbi:LysM peptidoglycan-binding domain-containing protein [Streptomyces sp. NBC_00083]|uniref:transglycosylase SLT domain-containing protein n=1 Tax=Streptomyces sp. NBC_00083 TaxID=2975647 RepID=UPI00224E2606|nr:LysM peptidoglycan-binding domain-containing protein [Streptomyces sp. NBC_00083]MCX5384261.1 LysM peptidoglycan-binding domain-containing protein [Streptomyces sp. NBC_00083]